MKELYIITYRVHTNGPLVEYPSAVSASCGANAMRFALMRIDDAVEIHARPVFA